MKNKDKFRETLPNIYSKNLMLTKVNEENGSHLRSLPCISCENDDDSQDSKEQLSASNMFIPNRHKFSLNLIREKEKMLSKKDYNSNLKLKDKVDRSHQIFENNESKNFKSYNYQSMTEFLSFSKPIFATNMNFNQNFNEENQDKKKSYKAKSLKRIQKVAQ